jgi:hypothetical protein
MKLEAQWIAGFVDGEGWFHVGFAQHDDMAMGVEVLPEFTVVQHERDAQVLYALKAYFGCGVVRRNHGDRLAYRVRDRRCLTETIAPFFMKHPLKSSKNVEFLKFRRVLLAMEAGRHLDPEGVEEIRRIAEIMNRNRPRESPAPLETGRE